MLRAAAFSRQLRNGDIIGVFLDLDNATIQFSLNGEVSPTISCAFGSREIFPAVSLIEDSDAVATIFGLSGIFHNRLWLIE